MESPQSETPENPTEPEEESNRPSPSRSKQKSAKKQIARFVIVFIVLVMTFLSGYRFLMDTNGNIRYLYVVSTHTSWVLGLIGHTSEVEPWSRDHSQDKTRAEIEAWNAGTEFDADAVVFSPDAESLSGWEVWKYKAVKIIKEGEKRVTQADAENAENPRVVNRGPFLMDQGPTVQFIYAQGTNDKRLKLNQKKNIISKDDNLTGAEKDTELALVDTDLAALTEEENKIPDGPERHKARSNQEFSFRVVPDCGAIPSMSIFVAAVLAFPSLLWKKGVGIFGGLTALYCINVGRLSTLAFIGAIDPTADKKWFNFIHEYVWQGIFLVFVVAIWMIWIELFIKVRRS